MTEQAALENSWPGAVLCKLSSRRQTMAWVLAMLDTIHGNLDENQQPCNFQEASLLITCSFDIARRCPAWPHKDCQRAFTKGCASGHGHRRDQVPDPPLQGRGASEAWHGVTWLVLRALEEFEPEGSRDGISEVLTKRKLLFQGQILLS